MDSMSVETAHTIKIKAGKTNPGPVGKVMKIPIHGIHHIINTMESMNSNHLNKMNLIKDKEAVVRRALRSCLKVSWFSRRVSIKDKTQHSTIMRLHSGTSKLKFRNSQGYLRREIKFHP